MNAFEHWQIRLSQLTREFYQLSMVHMQSHPSWQPAINAFRLPDRYLICVDLAGMQKPDISVRVDSRRLTISGNRPPPEPAPSHSHAQVLAMEIDYGPFERTLTLPEPIRPEQVTAQYREGLLWIQLPLVGASTPTRPPEELQP